MVACLRALYERLHGPTADYSHNMARDALRELLFPVVRDYLDRAAPEAEQDEFNEPEANDPQQLTSLLMRTLLADGWLEQFADRHGLVTAFRGARHSSCPVVLIDAVHFRFSRPGKLFSEALWALDRPSRSRQRNMRGCRNALDAALSARGDA